MLAPGNRLGPYEIGAPLGAGGMGEVYRARDTRLERTVAIKILPAQFSSDPIQKQRFEREAKTISNLNHPHICVLHDIGNQDGIDYLVMECVEGETLAKRLNGGPLQLDQVLRYGMQIADALNKAHRNGVIHRDLKPGNIMLTPGGAKLLDFGLAKVVVPVGTGATITLANQNAPVTEQGTIVGTFQYMSPEQIEGKELDGRSDIFSLGSVLYEMLTGKRAFDGKSQLSVASAILEKEPAPLNAMKPMTPPALGHAISRCLTKDPNERWQSAGDIKNELLWVSQSSGESALQPLTSKGKSSWARGFLSAAALAVLVVAAIAAAYFFSHRETSPAVVVRSVIALPPNVTLLTLGDEAGAPAISRDGSNLVFTGMSNGKRMLFLRPLNSTEVRPLPGSEGGKFPFWSPDGKSIGFFTGQQLKRLEIAGGPPAILASATDARGGTWAGDVILFTPYIYDVIYRVSVSGGKPVPVTTLERPKHTTHRWPHFLPDGKHFLYLAANHLNGKEGNSAIYAGSLDGGSSKLILNTNGSAFYSSGELFYFRDGTLLAQEFDADHLELRGDARPVAPVLRENGNWGVIACASQNGVVVFQNPGEVKYPISWFDRSGRLLGPAPISKQLLDLRLSQDRTRAAVTTFEGPNADASVYDLKTGARTKLTFGDAAWFIAWSPDGKRVVYSTQKPDGEGTQIYLQRADGAGGRELLLASGYLDHPTDWTRDGKYVVINRGQPGSQQIWIVPITGDRKPFRLFPNAAYDHLDGRVSPDGKWIAYVSAEAGPGEVYVTSFPGGIGKWQISTGGVVPAAMWRADGRELYFVTLEGNVMVASVLESAGSITIERVNALFRSPFMTGVVRTIFDVDPKDGQRFIGSSAPDTSTIPLNVIANWTAEPKNIRH